MKLDKYIQEAVSHGIRASKNGNLVRRGYDMAHIEDFERYLEELGFARTKESNLTDRQMLMQCDGKSYQINEVGIAHPSGLGYTGEIKVMLDTRTEKTPYTVQFDNRNGEIYKDSRVYVTFKNSAGYNVKSTSFEKFIEDIVYA